MTSKPGIDYSYNIDHKLENVSIGNSQTSYKYDALGNRYEVKKDGIAKTYIIDPNTQSVLMECDGFWTNKFYIYGHGLEYSIDSAGNEYIKLRDNKLKGTKPAGKLKNFPISHYCVIFNNYLNL